MMLTALAMLIQAMTIQAPMPPPIITSEKPSAMVPPTVEKSGTIVMYRTAGITGAISSCPVRYQGREIVNLGRGSSATWHVQPGRYVINNKVSSAEINVAANETRYVRCQIATGQGFAIQIVDQFSYDEKREGLKEKPLKGD